METIQGIHHITAFASDPQRNVHFYHHILGQRLVKTTVNFDDPGTYHLYYGDEVGSPGTIMTYFPWPHARPGRPGSGETGAVAYSIGPNSVDYWRERLTQFGLKVGPAQSRFGRELITFQDPDGMALELIVDEETAVPQHWTEGPIPAQHALRGFHSVTLWLKEAESIAALLTAQMGYQLLGQEENRWRFKGAGTLAPYVDILVDPNRPRGQMGAGSVHHVAFRTRNDAEQLEYQQALASAGVGVTEVKDRQYFHSIYFRTPGGVLFEIATDAPGFAIDEPVETLGQSLKLPPWLEPHREEISATLPHLEREQIGV